MLQVSTTSTTKWNDRLKIRPLFFSDGSPVKLSLPKVVLPFMADDCLVVGGYIRDSIAKLLYQGRQILLGDQQREILSEHKLIPQKYLPREKPYLDVDLITRASATELHAKGFKPTHFSNCYLAKRSDKDIDKIVKIKVLVRENFVPEAEIKDRDFYVNTFFMDKEGLVYDISGLALLGVLTKMLVTVANDPFTAFAGDCLKLLRAFYFHARDSYTFTPLLQGAIQSMASNTTMLQKAWDNISSNHRFSLWAKYFGEGFASDFFASLEKNNFTSFFFPPLTNDGKQECNCWIKARLVELDRGDYYNFEHPVEYFYAILLAAIHKYSNISTPFETYLKYWGMIEFVTISQPLINEFVTINELTVRTTPTKRQVDLLRIAELKAAKSSKNKNSTPTSVSAPVTPVMSAASSTQTSSCPTGMILSETNSPLPLVLPATVMTTTANTNRAQSVATSLAHSAVLIPTSTTVSTCSPLTLPARAIDAVPLSPSPVVWLESEFATEQTAVAKITSSTITTYSSRSAEIVSSAKTKVLGVSVDSTAINKSTTTTSIVATTTSKVKKNQPKFAPKLTILSRKQLKYQAELEAKKQLLEKWKEQLEREKQIKQQEVATKKQRLAEKLKQEEQKNLAEIRQRKTQSVSAITPSSTSAITNIAHTITVETVAQFHVTSTTSPSNIATDTTMLASMSTTLASIAYAKTMTTSEVSAADTTEDAGKEEQESKYTLPDHIYMCDFIGGPIYSLSRQDFVAMEIKLASEDEAKLTNFSKEYGCFYCNPIEGWRVCSLTEMPKSRFNAPSEDETIMLNFAPKKHIGKTVMEVEVSSFLVWKNLLNGQPVCYNDFVNNKKIFIVQKAMLRVFRQSRLSSQPITLQKDEFVVIRDDEWKKHLQQHYNNELLAACEMFNLQKKEDFLPSSIIALLNSISNKPVFWRYYKRGFYSCTIYEEQISTLLIDNTAIQRGTFTFEVLPYDFEVDTIFLSAINVAKLALAEQKIREARQTPKSRCCNLAGCVIL